MNPETYYYTMVEREFDRVFIYKLTFFDYDEQKHIWDEAYIYIDNNDPSLTRSHYYKYEYSAIQWIDTVVGYDVNILTESEFEEIMFLNNI